MSRPRGASARTGRERARFDLVGRLLVGCLLVASCAGPEGLRVFAAASLTDVVRELAGGFAEPIETSFGSSSALARQIRDGAPADVFLSASRDWIDLLEEAGAVDGEPVVFARNRLVAIAPRGSELGSALGGAASDAGALLTALGDGGRVAIADPGVPAGEYARAALEALGLLGDYAPRLVGQSDVRAALVAVERGELDAGFVYATDARAADVEVLFTFDSATHGPIEDWAVVLAGARSPEAARRFVASLDGSRARALLADAGFELP